MKLLVLDGNSIVNRAFYGIKLLTTKDGHFTNGIYGFMNVLLRLQESERPDEIVVAFDLKAPTFRHKMYDGYKANRKGMPPELAQQMPVLKELLSLLGYAQISIEGYEADDILGTLAAACTQRGQQCLLASGDRDTLQLVSPDVNVLLTTTKMGKSATVCMDEKAVFEKYGITPKQLIDVKALMGDASDNIPGVLGIGEKTALALIQKFGSLSAVYENIEDASIKPGARTKLQNGKDMAHLSYTLATIKCDVPLNTEQGAYKKAPCDTEGAQKLLSRLEMYSTLQRLNLNAIACEESGAPAKQLKSISVLPLPKDVSGMVFMARSQEGWLVVPAGQDTVYFAQEQEENFLDLLCSDAAYKRVFDSKELYKIALCATAQNGAKSACSITFDAKLAAYLLNPAAASYEVEKLATEYDIEPEFTCDEHPTAPLLEPLFRKLSQLCEQSEMKKLLTEIEQPLAEVLADMELLGVAVDAEGLREFGQELQAEIKLQLAAVHEAVGYEFNLNSPKQLGEALFEKLGLPHGRKTKSGYSTDAETLEFLRNKHPVIQNILTYRLYQKLNSTYAEGLLKVIDADGRIRSTFNQTEARTGRLSSGEPNLQNIPVRTELGSRLRKYFVAKKGCVFADADYSQIELRILADISQDAAMKEAFCAGQDIHKATAARVNGLPQIMVTPQMRSAAKAVNFGIVYGIGAFSLSKDIGMSVKEADEFIKSYLASFPGVKQYMTDTVSFGTEHGYVKTLYGRRRALSELASSNRNVRALGERIAMNTPIQGTAADIIKLAMIRVWRRLRSENLQSRLILQVHDELIVEGPQEELSRVCDILKEEMEGAAQLSVPLSADVHSGEDWLQAKS